MDQSVRTGRPRSRERIQEKTRKDSKNYIRNRPGSRTRKAGNDTQGNGNQGYRNEKQSSNALPVAPIGIGDRWRYHIRFYFWYRRQMAYHIR
jgi:hypothetical protein